MNSDSNQPSRSSDPPEHPRSERTPDAGMMAWLRLLRISALPSAVSNILMAYLLAHQAWSPTLELGLLIVASSALYLAGMVLNDVNDYAIDLQQRPGRPLPSGQISVSTAKATGLFLLVAGVVLASLAGWIGSHGASLSWSSPFGRATIISILLAICILLYDGPLKQTLMAPFLMGSCRSLNILLGASTFIPLAVGLDAKTPNLFLGLPLIVWWVAAAIGTLVMGVTLLGRREAVDVQPRTPLVVAAAVIVAGLIGLALVVYCPSSIAIGPQTKKVFPLFLGLISLTIFRRLVEAVAVAKPKPIQRAVVSVLRSMIIFDAAICYLVQPDQIGYALAVLALLIPTLLLARFVPST